MKEIDIKVVGVQVKSEVRKLRSDFKIEYGEPIIVNVTGKSDEELAEQWMKDNPELRKMYEEYVREERRKKLNRILK